MISARRRPPACSSTWRMTVVLPAPRKPVTMVTGIFAMARTCISSGVCRAGWTCGRAFGRRRETDPGRRTQIAPVHPARRGRIRIRRPVSWLVGRCLPPPSRLAPAGAGQWLCRRSARHVQLRGQPRFGRMRVPPPAFPFHPLNEGPSDRGACCGGWERLSNGWSWRRPGGPCVSVFRGVHSDSDSETCAADGVHVIVDGLGIA